MGCGMLIIIYVEHRRRYNNDAQWLVTTAVVWLTRWPQWFFRYSRTARQRDGERERLAQKKIIFLSQLFSPACTITIYIIIIIYRVLLNASPSLLCVSPVHRRSTSARFAAGKIEPALSRVNAKNKNQRQQSGRYVRVTITVYRLSHHIIMWVLYANTHTHTHRCCSSIGSRFSGHRVKLRCKSSAADVKRKRQ
jgi:hypothetical protein